MKLFSGIGVMIGFLVVFFGPGIGFLVLPKAETSQIEKRQLESFPHFQQPLRAALKQFERYFSDHLPLRENMTQWYHRLFLSLFSCSPMREVLIGEQGWMYFSAERSIEDTLGRISLEESRLSTWAMLLQNRKDWFERQGIRYLFFVAPDKQSIYPEYLPEPYRKRVSATKRMDQLLDYLHRYTDVPVLDLRPVLQTAKRRQPVYYRTDTHWNGYGGWSAYQALMDVIEPWVAGVHRLTDNRIRVVETTFELGDLAARFWPSGTIQETEVTPWVPEACGKRIRSIFNELSYVKTCPDADRRVLVLHDSFFNLIEPFLSESFGVSVYLWKKYPAMESYDHDWVQQVIAEYRPHLVIEERVERFLEHPQTFPPHLQFAYGIPVMVCDPDHGFIPIQEYRDIQIRQTAQGLDVRPLSGDSGFLIDMQHVPQRSGIFRIEIESPKKGSTLQVFFKRHPKDGYEERRSRRYPLDAGWNDIYIGVEPQWMGAPIRCDLDDVSGVYRVKSLELRLMSQTSDPSQSIGTR